MLFIKLYLLLLCIWNIIIINRFICVCNHRDMKYFSRKPKNGFMWYRFFIATLEIWIFMMYLHQNMRCFFLKTNVCIKLVFDFSELSIHYLISLSLMICYAFLQPCFVNKILLWIQFANLNDNIVSSWTLEYFFVLLDYFLQIRTCV